MIIRCKIGCHYFIWQGGLSVGTGHRSLGNTRASERPKSIYGNFFFLIFLRNSNLSVLRQASSQFSGSAPSAGADSAPGKRSETCYMAKGKILWILVRILKIVMDFLRLISIITPFIVLWMSLS